MRCLASSRGNLLLTGLLVTTSTANVVDLSIYPEVYQDVLNATENAMVLTASSAQSGLINIQNTIHNDLNYTRNCIKSLTVTQATECFDAGKSFLEEEIKSWTNEEFLAQARFRNLFAPGYIDKTLGMMLFDTSFKYFGKYGFHQNAQLLIKNCALARCKDQKDEIIEELTNVNAKYNTEGTTHLAGNHYQISWSKMVDRYNKNGGAPSDNYNFWMPAIEDGESWHSFDFNTTEIALGDDERHTWYTAMRFAVVHHFHHYYLFGEDGLFTMGYQTSEDELLQEAEKQFKDSSLVEEEFLQKFAQFQEKYKDARFEAGKMRTFTDFKRRVHLEGMNYMLGRDTNYERFIFQLGLPTTWYRKGLMTKLGFKETEERTSRMMKLAQTMYAMKATLWKIEHQNNGTYIQTCIMLSIPYIILSIIMLIFICKGIRYFLVVWGLMIAFIRCLFCIKKKVEPEEEDELLSMYAERFGRPTSQASTRSRPTSKQQSTRNTPRGEDKKKEAESTNLNTVEANE